MNCLSSLSLLLLVLVLGPQSSTVLATVLFPMEGSILLPLDYMNTTGVIDLDNPIIIGGQKFIAMEISTGGIIFFYSEEWAISVVAPLASDIDLSCPAQSNENVACYDFREDPDLLYWAKSIIANRTGNDTFKPTSLIIATWNQVQRFGCPEDLEANTFQAVIATGTTENSTEIQSYAIFLYRQIEWLDDNAVIGVIDGHGRPLFVLGLTPSIIQNLVQGPSSGVLVVDLNNDDMSQYQEESTTSQDAMGHHDTSKLSAYSAKLQKPIEVLQQSIDLYLK